MKKENLQNSQEGTGSENRGNNREEQRDSNTIISVGQQNDTPLQAGLGRDRMADIEDLGISEREDYAGDDDLTNENLNAANDQ